MNSHSQTSASLSKRVLEEAWISLLGFYGRAFESQYGNIDGEEFRLWFAGLTMNGVTDAKVASAVLAVAVEHARKTSHTPNYADFLRLCTGDQANDAQAEDKAFAEANAAARTWNHHVWTSAAIYHATIAVGVWTLRQFPEKVTRPRFVEAYRKLVEQERAGRMLEVPPVLTDNRPESSPVTAKAATQNRDRMKLLSKALLELPDNLQRIATGALKDGKFVLPELLLPSGIPVSASSRAVLLEYCCNTKVDLQEEEALQAFAPPSL